MFTSDMLVYVKMQLQYRCELSDEGRMKGLRVLDILDALHES